MKRKHCGIIIALVAVLVCAMCLVACRFGDKRESGGTENEPNNPNMPNSHTHSYTNYTYNNDATCVTDGTETAHCAFTGCVETDTRIKANTATGEHTYTTYEYNNNATCVDDGTETAKCDVCHAVPYTRTKADTATGIHTFTTYTYNNDATCGSNGTETSECSICHNAYDTHTKDNSATGAHMFSGYTCRVCGDYTSTAPLAQGLDYEEITSNGTVVGYSVVGIGEAADTEILIPKTHNDKPVISIGDNAFFECSNITRIVLPNSITNIGNNAFYYCISLTSINIPNSVTSIGYSAFNYCISLTSINIPNSVTSILSSVFDYCESLTSVNIPDSVTSIGYSAFGSCRSLTSIEIPNSVTSIEKTAFAHCSSLTSIEIPSDVTSIGDMTFYGCSSLTSIEIPNSVTDIGYWAFNGCSSLIAVKIPKSVISMGYGIFKDCRSVTIYCEALSQPNGWEDSWCSKNGTSDRYPIVWNCEENDKDEDGYMYSVIGGVRYKLKDKIAAVIEQPSNMSGAIIIPEYVRYDEESYRVTSISDRAFYNCVSITSVEMETDIEVTRIGNYAFASCFRLTKVDIPYNVTNIGDRAFQYCSSLTSIEIPIGVVNVGNSLFDDCIALTVYCAASRKPSGWSNSFNSECPVVWSCNTNDKDTNGYAYSVIDGVRYRLKDGIATVVRQSRSISGEIIIPETVTYNYDPYIVTSIDWRAFWCCSSLTSVEIPNSIESIGESAFYGCSSLTSIEIPSSVESIGGYAFSDCNSLTIYCEAADAPDGWSEYWNNANRPVVWDYKNQEI